MALDATNFHTVAAGNPGCHYYKSTDAIATIAAADYFNDITGRLRQFDIITVVGSTGGTATVDVLTVTSATEAASVTTTNGT